MTPAPNDERCEGFANKTEQAQIEGQKRWFVHTNQGRKVVWAPTVAVARERAVAAGLTVRLVEPAPPASL